MGTNVHHSVQLGDLVVAAFDVAARQSADPREVSRQAATTVLHMLRRAARVAASAAVMVDVRGAGPDLSESLARSGRDFDPAAAGGASSG